MRARPDGDVVRRRAPLRSLSVLMSLVLAIGVIGSGSRARGEEARLGAAVRSELPHAQDHVLVKFDPGAEALESPGPDVESVLGRWRRVPVGEGETAIEAVMRLAATPGVALAELDYVFELEPEFTVLEGNAGTQTSVNDPFTQYQWHLPAIQAGAAWDESTGADVVIAIVDSGVSQVGEDLDCHTFLHPYNAITRTAGVDAADDDVGHGTHVAGTAVQCTDNGVGVAGIAFDASVMPIKVLDVSGEGEMSWVAHGIDWARQHDADVINLSLGCDSCTSSLVSEAIETAVDSGAVVVAASGNSGLESVGFPASHPDVIAVGAVDYNLNRTSYSNGGSDLTLVAPGGDLTVDQNGDGFSDGVLQETFEISDATRYFGYYFFEGTSMATPHVSGVAALLLSLAPGTDPDEIRSVLEASASDLGPAGPDTSYGHGLLQAHVAIDRLLAPVFGAEAELIVEAFGETSLTVSWGSAIDNIAVVDYVLRLAGTTGDVITGREANIGGLDPGTAYVFEVLARDRAGNLSAPVTTQVRTARHFLDTQGHLFYNDVLWMSGSDVTRGCNPPVNDLFCPDDSVTRGQMAAFLVRALRLGSNTHSGFSDVPAENIFAADIGRLATAGITRGCNPPGNDEYCPDDFVTRGEMAAFLVRALGFVDDGGGGLFVDADRHTFERDIDRLATAGVTKGCNPPDNDQFCPDDPVTRGQMAAFLFRALGR